MFLKIKMMYHNTMADLYYLLLRNKYKLNCKKLYNFIGKRCAHHTFRVFQITEDIIKKGS